MSEKYTHECYIGRYNGQVLYVGSGVKGRHKHINSGKSHVVELNMMFLKGMLLDVEVMQKSSKESALLYEEELIKELDPIFNVMLTRDGKLNREKRVNDFLASIDEKPVEQRDVVYTVAEEVEVDPKDINLIFKTSGKWASLIIKDAPVAYVRVNDYHASYWSKDLHYDVYVYSLIMYLTLDQLNYLTNVAGFSFRRVDKVLDRRFDTKDKHSNLYEQPYAEGLYACTVERNAFRYGGKGINEIKLKTMTEQGLVDRDKGVRNGTKCSIKFIYLPNETDLLLDTVVVKGSPP